MRPLASHFVPKHSGLRRRDGSNLPDAERVAERHHTHALDQDRHRVATRHLRHRRVHRIEDRLHRRHRNLALRRAALALSLPTLTYAVNALLQLLRKHVQQKLTILGITTSPRTHARRVDATQTAKQLLSQLRAVDEVTVVSKRDSITTLNATPRSYGKLV